MPPVFIALFFFLVNVGTLQHAHREQHPGLRLPAFQLPTAILLGVTGVSRAPALVIDVQDGYFDRLLLTPVRRIAILLGHLAADVTSRPRSLSPIIIVGFILGVRFESGPLGILVFILIAALWSLAFSGFGYAIALKTGNPGAVNSSVLAVLPVPVPHDVVRAAQSAQWLARCRRGLEPRDLPARRDALARARRGWDADALAKTFVAIAIVGAISMTLCFAALRGRHPPRVMRGYSKPGGTS